jgi:hypothetical protein
MGDTQTGRPLGGTHRTGARHIGRQEPELAARGSARGVGVGDLGDGAAVRLQAGAG